MINSGSKIAALKRNLEKGDNNLYIEELQEIHNQKMKER